ncbi:MAG: DNA polymerase IV [Woeseiaceae bacterium]|nr:DNA polymerase IV [Woeseiaceae bacterium]
MSAYPDRCVLHVDMDAFYASVEQRDDPSLRGKPLVVGGGNDRGVVAAASYEARRFGIRSAMPMRDARRRCPGLLRVKPRMDHYRAISAGIFSIFNDYSPLVEGLSLDEAFLDVTDSLTLFGNAERIAAGIKRTVHERTGLTASVGVAPNKLVAKIASDLDKPDGLVVVGPDAVQAVLDPLPAEVIPGIGRKTLVRLHAAGIRTIRDLRTAPDRTLEQLFGRHARATRARARGQDTRPVVSDRAGKSVSAEETFDRDLVSFGEMQRELLRLAERTAARLRAKNLLAGTVQLKIRESDFTTCTRRRALQPPDNATRVLYEGGLELLRAWLDAHPGAAIRLLGIGGSDLAPAGQGDLFATMTTAGPGAVDRAADQIRARFGAVRLGRARTFGDKDFS